MVIKCSTINWGWPGKQLKFLLPVFLCVSLRGMVLIFVPSDFQSRKLEFVEVGGGPKTKWGSSNVLLLLLLLLLIKQKVSVFDLKDL